MTIQTAARLETPPMPTTAAQRLRWAFGTPRYLQMARDRAAGTVRSEVVAS